MASISSAGLGSGLDVAGLVDQLVAAEREPAETRINRKEAGIQASLSAIGTLKSALTDVQDSLTGLRSPSAFQKKDVELDKEDFLSASATGDIPVGTYTVDVDRLATSQRLASNSFSSDLDFLGAGSLTFQRGSVDPNTGNFLPDPEQVPVTLEIAPEQGSLSGIRDAINSAEIGVRASIVNDGSGFILVLASSATGANNNLRIQASDNDGNDVDLAGLSSLAYDAGAVEGNGRNLTETATASNAQVFIDGISISSPSNTVADAIQGLTLELAAPTEGQSVNVSVSADRQTVKEGIAAFVETYNTFVSTADELTRFDPETQERGPLLGDSTVRGALSQLRRLISTSFADVNENFPSLASIGISTDRNGTLTLDDAKLQSAIDSDFDEVTRLFARVGMASDSQIRFIGADEETATGLYEVEILNPSTQGSYTGSVFSGFPLTIDDSNNTFIVSVDGTVSSDINLEQKSYLSAQELANELQSRVNANPLLASQGVGVAVQVDGNALQILSNSFGRNSSVNIVSADPAMAASLGLSTGNGTPGTDVEGRIGGVLANGNGNTLVGTGLASGISIEVLGGGIGSRGNILFSRGTAEELGRTIESLSSSEGLFSTRTEGLNSRIGDLTRQRETLDRRMQSLEERLRRQFSGLDATLGSLQETSNFLSNQLAGLPGARGSAAGGAR